MGSELRTSTIKRVTGLLADGAKTSAQIAFATGISQYGVDSCLLGLWRREQIVKLKAKPGQNPKWRKV